MYITGLTSLNYLAHANFRDSKLGGGEVKTVASVEVHSGGIEHIGHIFLFLAFVYLSESHWIIFHD